MSNHTVLGAGRCAACGAALSGGDCPSCAVLRTVSATCRLSLTVRGAAGQDSTAGELPLTPEFSSRYTLVRVLGRGSAGMVMMALDGEVGRHVAIKFLMRLEDGDRERFLAEARVLARVESPHVVRIFDLGELGDHPFLVTELLEGTLRERMEREGAMAPAAAVEIALEILDGLGACHARGVVHRDVKPENVLFGSDGGARLVDLGIARMWGEVQRFTQTGAILGTPRYMAPEQVLAQDAGAAADLYAVGLVLYELLSGRPAFPQRTLVELLEARNAPLPDVRAVAPQEVPAALAHVVAEATSRLPSDRPPTAEAMAQRLRKALARPTRPAAPARPRPQPRRSKAIWVALTVATMIAGSLSALLARRGLPPVSEPVTSPSGPPPVAVPSRPRPSPRPTPAFVPPPAFVAPTPSASPRENEGLINLMKSYIDKYERMTPAECKELKTSLVKFAYRPGRPGALEIRELREKPIRYYAGEFGLRLQMLGGWMDWTPEARAICDYLQLAWYVNAMHATRRLSTALERMAAGQKPTLASVRAPLPPLASPLPPEPLAAPADPRERFTAAVKLYADACTRLETNDPGAEELFTRVARSMAALVREKHELSVTQFYLGAALHLRDASPEDGELACELLERSAKLDDHAVTRCMLGSAHMLAGRSARAIKELQAAVALDPKLGEAHFRLALVFDRRPEPGSGRKAFEHAKAAIRQDSRYKARFQSVLRRLDVAQLICTWVLEVIHRIEGKQLTEAQIDVYAQQAADVLGDKTQSSWPAPPPPSRPAPPSGPPVPAPSPADPYEEPHNPENTAKPAEGPIVPRVR